MAHKMKPASLAALLFGCFAAGSHAALTDIASAPLIVSFGVPVKPNVLVIMDDSGSMAETYLPEVAWRGYGRYSFRAAQCNGMGYDAAASYPLPMDASGATLAPAGTSGAYNADNDLGDIRSASQTNLSAIETGTIVLDITNSGAQNGWYSVGDLVTVYDNGNKTRWMLGKVTGWNSSTKKLTIEVDARSGDVKLGTVRVGRGYPLFVYFEYTGSEPRLGWTYDSNGAVITSSNFYKECNSLYGQAPGSSKFVRKIASNSQHYQNWYAYYSNRNKMIKTVVSRAFAGINDTYRVGYTRISDKSAKEEANKWLNIRDFDSSQKSKFYASLYATPASSYTPLRGALSMAGKYFANKAPDQAEDPVQHACQKNFAILATDGAWNTDLETSTFGPYGLDGAKVGDQDGNAAKVATPQFDALKKADTLADVAQYYYVTDLRDSKWNNCTGAGGANVCENNVEPVGKDDAKHQHMTTFTLSLGQNGTLRYCDGYETACVGGGTTDFGAIKNGSLSWPDPFSSTSQAAKRVDDLWHAAVNGRGTYFNSSDASQVAEGLKAALSQIEQVTGQGSAGATSTMQPVAGNNLMFIARFTSGVWSGDVRAHEIDLATGVPKTKGPGGSELYLWSAHEKVKAQATRKILYAKSGSLKEFTFTNLNADGFGAEFAGKCSSLSQYSGLSAAQQTECVSGDKLVDFLRGAEYPYYRARASKLGDFVGSAPTYEGKSAEAYSDPSYASYAAARKSRPEMLYVGSNDGMLHAFAAGPTGGNEVWAFIPSEVRGRMWKLADKSYGSQHQFYVDGPAIAADVQFGGGWKTVLVGGLGSGGKSYYALDVTDPLNPKLLWEFSDPNLGYTHAQPVVVKRPNGNWVVAVPSGFNNAGDGKGRLFLLDVATGAKVVDMPTSVGDAGTPAGLGPVVAWVEDKKTNVATRYYAGDNLGNLWRFDTEGLVEPKNAALRLAEFKSSGSKPQPITVRPLSALMKVSGLDVPLIVVGTGRMVGNSDLSNKDPQSIYAVKDPLVDAPWGDYRALIGTKVVKQVVTEVPGNPPTRSGTAHAIDWSDKAGWAVDMPDAGERINVPMQLVGGTVVAASNIPKTIASCQVGNQGSAWLYFLDIATGASKFSYYPDSMVAGITVIQLDGSKVIPNPAIGDPDKNYSIPAVGGVATKPRRANWREVTGQ